MALFIVYRTSSGTPTQRDVLRWGDCPPASIAAQANIDEGAVEVASHGGLANRTDPMGYTIDPATGALTFFGAPYSPTPAEYERAMFEARADLRVALRASDWAVLPDAPLTAPQKADWLTYRANLRSIATDPLFGQPNSAVGYPPAPSTTEF